MKSWIKAFRLRTLPLAIAGWMVGSSIAWNEGHADASIAALTLLTAIFLQILSNLANDLGDATSGVDAERKGEARMVNTGAITVNAMKRAIVIMALLAFVSGCALLYVAFPDNWKAALMFMAIGLLGIAAAINYTVGKNPYGYSGFGDVFVFVFFGVVLVFGSYYLQTGVFQWEVMLPATAIGLFCVGVLNVNNIRDIDTDKAAGKNSIPVRLGKKKAEVYHAVLLVTGMISAVVYTYLRYEYVGQLLFLFAFMLLFKNVQAVKTKSGAELDPFLKQMAIATLIFSLLFALGQGLSW